MNQGGNRLQIISLNIHGVKSKLENPTCSSLFMNYDIVFLSEIKCTYPFSLPGFHCLRSEIVCGQEGRCGMAVLFKHATWNQVFDVQRLKDQV